MTAPNIVFGLASTRTDDDFLDELMDAIDLLLGEGAVWEMIMWRRTAATRILMFAPLVVRSLVDQPSLQMSSTPRTRLFDDMENNRNEWLLPAGSPGRRSPAEEARDDVNRWTENLWGNVEDGMPETPASPSDDETVVKEPGYWKTAIETAFGLGGLPEELGLKVFSALPEDQRAED